MYYKTLIEKSSRYIHSYPGLTRIKLSANLFGDGGAWMQTRLCELNGNRQGPAVAASVYTFYGALKYSICLAAFITSAMLFYGISAFLVPLAILVFYFFEVHFLFLFPLVIDGVKNPLLTSIGKTYQTGLWRAMATVIPIGLFMIAGLADTSQPLKKWHIGCFCILIWYQDEIRNRL